MKSTQIRSCIVTNRNENDNDVVARSPWLLRSRGMPARMEPASHLLGPFGPLGPLRELCSAKTITHYHTNPHLSLLIIVPLHDLFFHCQITRCTV